MPTGLPVVALGLDVVCESGALGEGVIPFVGGDVGVVLLEGGQLGQSRIENSLVLCLQECLGLRSD